MQNCQSPMWSSTEWSWFFMEFVLFPLFTMHLDYYSIQRLYDQTVYIFISCILMPQNCIKSGKSCQMYAIFTMFSSSGAPFLHYHTINMLGVPNLHHKHHVVLFIFTIIFFTTIWYFYSNCLYYYLLNILTSKAQATYDIFHINIFL